MSSKDKKDKTLPKRNEPDSNSPVAPITPIQMLGEIYSNLLPGQKVPLEMQKNKNNSMTLKSPETGDTIVANESGNNVRYKYNPKKK